MLLFCSVCGKPWRRFKDPDPDHPPKRPPPASCQRCRGKHFGTIVRQSWKARRRRLELAGEAARLPATGALPDLDRLMAELDVAEAKALKAAASVKGVGGAPSRK
jgi:hypothetical protein